MSMTNAKREIRAALAEFDATRPFSAERNQKYLAFMHKFGPEEARTLLAELDTLRRERDIAQQAMEGMRVDANRYLIARRKVCIVGDKFHIINLAPTHVAPNPAVEFDAAIDASAKEQA